MEDSRIVELYWDRDENAITVTAEKYGNYCRKIAMNILYNEEDSNECVNDTYLAAWNSMPDQRPTMLGAFLSAITRNLSLDMFRKSHSQKRGEGQITEVIDEMYDLAGGSTPEEEVDKMMLASAINLFLGTLNKENRLIFMRRYYYMDSLSDIADKLSLSEGKVKTSLFRSRNKLKEYLIKEGYTL